jgi:hypothetical protein
MVNYNCKKCGKGFKQKGHLKDHLNKKIPCDKLTNFPETSLQISKNLNESPLISLKNHEFTLKNHEFHEFSFKNHEKPFKNHEKILKIQENHEKPFKNHEKILKIQENHEISLRNHDFSLDSNENHEILINSETMKKYLKNSQCVYCEKVFSRKDNVITHIKNHCKKVKEIEKVKYKIFIKLKNLEDENVEIKEQNIQIKEQNKILIDEMKKITELLTKKNMHIEQNFLSNHNHNHNYINNTNNTNNNDNSKNINNNIKQQNIMLVGYGNEDMSKINKDDMVKCIKRGYRTPIEMTKLTNFNENHPEYHNIYIPRINEKHGMMFKNNIWELIDKDELAVLIHDNNKAYVEDNLDEFMKHLNPMQQKSLKQWLQTHEHDQSVMNTKEEIKNLLYTRKHMALAMKKEIEKKEKENLKKDIKKIF